MICVAGATAGAQFLKLASFSKAFQKQPERSLRSECIQLLETSGKNEPMHSKQGAVQFGKICVYIFVSVRKAARARERASNAR